MDRESSEIVKLTERIAKDPKSKLFVPLAEEYKKVGDGAKAVAVLKEGLRNNPGYVTARSFLGRLLMDMGDLAGAQKELEEVIKAIPDNLLAQRKLGDLYLLQEKSNEALQRYKAALMLNPGDKDLRSFVADLEAGKDISSRIVRPKAAPAPTAAGKPTPGTPAAPKAPVAPAASPLARPATQTPPAAPPRPAAAPAAPAPTAPAAVTEEPQRSKQAPAPAPVPPQAQKTPTAPAPKPAPPVAASTEEETAQKTSAAPAPKRAADGDISAVEGLADMEPLQQLAAEAAALQERRSHRPSSTHHAAPAGPPAEAFDLSEPAEEPFTFIEEPQDLEWAPPAEPAPDLTEEVKAAEPGDDINTDTLAELYISQSFYEKAIEIYERMLSERPGSKALEQKLEQLRSLAAAAEQTGTDFILAADAAQAVPAAGEGEHHPAVDAGDSGIPAEEAIPFQEMPEPAAEVPVERPKVEPVQEVSRPEPQTAERQGTGRDDSRGAAQDAPEGSFQQKPSPTPATEQAAGHAPQSATLRRKETIDRLELWLKNVMKEKPQ